MCGGGITVSSETSHIGTVALIERRHISLSSSYELGWPDILLDTSDGVAIHNAAVQYSELKVLSYFVSTFKVESRTAP